MIIKVYNGLAQKVVKGQGIFVLVFVLFYAISFACWAQPDKVSQDELQQYYPKRLITSVELLAGPSFVFGKGSELFNEYRIFKAGFSGGVGLIINIDHRFKVQTNILFEIKGYKQSINAVNMDSGYARPARLIDDMALKYFTISVLPKYYLMRGHLSFGLGPYIGYLNSLRFYQESYVNGILTSRYTRKILPYEIFKKYDYGITATAGLSFNKDDGFNWSLNLLYNLGLVDINQPMTIGLNRNNTYSILITIKI